MFRSRMSLRKTARVCYSLAVALEAGIPVGRAFALAGEHGMSARQKHAFAAVAERVAGGRSLGEALRAESGCFPALFTEALGAAESGGSLSEMLRHLAGHYEERLALRRTVLRQLAYPLGLLFCIAVLLPIGISFLEMTAGVSSHAGVGDLLIEHAWRLLGIAARVAAGIAVLAVLARLGVLRRVWDVIALHLWPLAGMMRRIDLALFLHTLSMLLRAGLDLPESIERSAAVAPNRLMGRQLLRLIPPLRSGSTFAEALTTLRWLPRTAYETLSIGEISGRLPDTLEDTARALHAEGRHPMYVIASILETVFLLGIGLMVLRGMR